MRLWPLHAAAAMFQSPESASAIDFTACDRVEVGPGCFRYDLPAAHGVRPWVVEIAPGAQWPHVDHHNETGEFVFVVSGELIEGDLRFPEGSYLLFGPMSEHQPRSEHGVRLFGFNLVETDSKMPTTERR